jgi:hypothetical protein
MASFSTTMTMFTKTLTFSTWVHWISNQLICICVYWTTLIVGLVDLYINICSMLSLAIYIKHHSFKDLLSVWTIKFFHKNNIGYTSLPKLGRSICQFVCQGPETHITFNKIVPPNSRAQKLFMTLSSYILLLLLRSFPRSNCCRRWGRYFWDLEGGWGDLGALFLG